MASASDSKRLQLGVGFTLIVILLISLYIFLRETDKTLVYFVLLVVLALAAAMVTVFIPGKIAYSDGPLRAGGSFAVFILVILVGLGFYKWNSDHPQSFNITVFVRDIHQQTVLREGNLQLLLGSNRPQETIDPSGSVFFRDVPAVFKNSQVQVELLGSDDYQFTNGTKVDTLTLTGQANILTVEPDQRRCCLKGLIVNQYGKSVAGAQVWTGTLTPVQTDSLGRFNVVLPMERRMEEDFDVYVRKGRMERHIRMDHVQISTIELPEEKQ